MGNATREFEELFLKIFKGTILIIMGFSLLATIGLCLFSMYEFTQSPKKPTPARKAPDRDPVAEIRLVDLQNHLIEQELQKNQPSANAAPPQQGKRHSGRYLEDATTLYRCSGDYATKVGIIINETNEEFLQRVGVLRNELEKRAKEPHRGETWVKAVVAFACNALHDDELVSLKQEKKVGSVFYPLIDFHMNAWDKIYHDKMKFEQEEEQRVQSERNAESSRVLKAKALAITCLSIAACFFGLFMLLALYLLFAKIENNMREINLSIQAKGAKDQNAVTEESKSI
jgi:hypothetical protein